MSYPLTYVMCIHQRVFTVKFYRHENRQNNYKMSRKRLFC